MTRPGRPVSHRLFLPRAWLLPGLRPNPAEGRYRLASMSSVAKTLWVTREKGFFAKNVVDAQTIFIPGSPTLIATLSSGDVQFGYTGGTATLGSALGGLDVKYGRGFRQSGAG